MPPPRTADPPHAVRLASALLIVCAALSAFTAVAAFVAVSHLGTASEVLSHLASDAETPDTVASIRWSLWYDGVVAVASMLVLPPLAYAVRRPSQPARVATWSVATVTVMALFCGVSASPDVLEQPIGIEPAAVQRAMRNLVPAWYPQVHALAVAATAAGIIAVAVLLLRSSVQDFYRLRSQGSEPGLWSLARRGPDDSRR